MTMMFYFVHVGKPQSPQENDSHKIQIHLLVPIVCHTNVISCHVMPCHVMEDIFICNKYQIALSETCSKARNDDEKT